jgi:hypothetical protein
MQVVRSYLKMVSQSEFMLPFYSMLLLTLNISDHQKMEAQVFIEDDFGTSWGGGRVVNHLLFGDRAVVSQSQQDLFPELPRNDDREKPPRGNAWKMIAYKYAYTIHPHTNSLISSQQRIALHRVPAAFPKISASRAYSLTSRTISM